MTLSLALRAEVVRVLVTPLATVAVPLAMTRVADPIALVPWLP